MPFVIEKSRDPFYKEGMQKGMQKGIQKGLVQGKLEEQRAIAISLLDILDDETISKKVGLKLSEVKKLRREHQGD